jgi:hypothetical protein
MGLEYHMRKLNFALAGFVAFAIVAAPTFASASKRDGNGTYCQSGAYVKNPKACKENGGKR